MNFVRQLKLVSWISFFMLGSNLAFAQVGSVPSTFQLDIDYSEIQAFETSKNPAALAVPDLVLVGWYGSKATQIVYSTLNINGYQPTLWPLVARESWRGHSRLMLMANKLKLSPEQQLEIFVMVQQVIQDPPSTGLDWLNYKTYSDFLNHSQIKPNQIEEAIYDSDLPRQLKSLQKSLSNYPITQVPTILYKNRFLITSQQAKTAARLVSILEYLDTLP